MELSETTRRKLRRIGAWLLPAGILLLLLGSGLQLTLFLSSGGESPGKDPAPMVWASIIAAIGIPAIVAGQLLRMVGKWEHEPEEEVGPRLVANPAAKSSPPDTGPTADI